LRIQQQVSVWGFKKRRLPRGIHQLPGIPKLVLVPERVRDCRVFSLLTLFSVEAYIEEIHPADCLLLLTMDMSKT
jgi:hypothetical protein